MSWRDWKPPAEGETRWYALGGLWSTGWWFEWTGPFPCLFCNKPVMDLSTDGEMVCGSCACGWPTKEESDAKHENRRKRIRHLWHDAWIYNPPKPEKPCLTLSIQEGPVEAGAVEKIRANTISFVLPTPPKPPDHCEICGTYINETGEE